MYRIYVYVCLLHLQCCIIGGGVVHGYQIHIILWLLSEQNLRLGAERSSSPVGLAAKAVCIYYFVYYIDLHFAFLCLDHRLGTGHGAFRCTGLKLGGACALGYIRLKGQLSLLKRLDLRHCSTQTSAIWESLLEPPSAICFIALC